MKYFLDCGSNIGQSFEYFHKKYGSEYHYVLFEPNCRCCAELIRKYGEMKNVTICNKAVYIDSSEKTFRFVSDYSVGGSIIRSHNSAMKHECLETKVDCINFLEFVNDLIKQNAEIVIKMDIESSEYDILEHMISNGSILHIKKIYCEFHSQYMNHINKRIFQKRENNILDFVKRNNINFQLWK